MKKDIVAAIDLGATSGRVIVGEFSKNDFTLTEVHRFPNTFHTLNQNQYWDIGGLYDEICQGLREAQNQFPDLLCCGIDTWGVDCVYLNKDNRLVFPVHAYRDERTNQLMEEIIAAGQDRRLFELTGIPMVRYNTGMQIAECLRAVPPLKEACDKVMLLPEYFNFLLSGEDGCEFSHASSTQLLDVHGEDFSSGALNYFGIPEHWLQAPRPAGYVMGQVQNVSGVDNLDLVCVPGHDTSCAFEAIPLDGNSLIVSSGTWMLIGGMTDGPCMGDVAFELGVSNERTGTGGFRPNKIRMGMWLLEQTIPFFESRPRSDSEWSALISAGEEKTDPDVLIDTNDSTLFNPKNMRTAIENQVKANGGTAPTDLPEFLNLICHSLGYCVRETADKFEEILGKSFDNIVIVGGGAKNRLLCQKIADYSEKYVTSYELEATSLGNMAYQLLGKGKINSISEFHEIIRPNLAGKKYTPR